MIGSARRARLERARTEAGYVLLLTAILSSSVFLVLAALGVDVSRWYMEIESVQNAADAAALAGVTYMPTDFTAATAKALTVASQNGYTTNATTGTSVEVTRSVTRPSQLRVTISSRIPNVFGASFGVGLSTVSRSSLAEYSGPAPIGSPCNVFGNEPPSQPLVSGTPNQGAYPVGQPAGSALPTSGGFAKCTSNPQYWSAMEGPQTDKTQGDRYQTNACGRDTNATSPAKVTYGCTASKTNAEYRTDGYFYILHIEPGAVGQSVEAQVYDPAYIETGSDCEDIPDPTSGAPLANNMNPWTTTDGKARYVSSASIYCAGDRESGSDPSGTFTPTTTSFVVLSPNDTKDPGKSTPVNNTSCIKQFKGLSTAPTTAQLTVGNSNYNAQMARVFHQWVPLCSFIPTQSGDYYIEARTNVAFGGTTDSLPGTALVSSGNAAAWGDNVTDTTGHGTNGYSLRLNVNDAYRKLVSISGYRDMPIRMNADNPTANFYLIRVLPGPNQTRFVDFSFFDAADNVPATSTGYVQIIPPLDASSSNSSWSAGTAKVNKGCKYGLNDTDISTWIQPSGNDCKVTVKPSITDGQVMNVHVPVPTDYNCDTSTLAGCWYTVTIGLAGTKVSDFETWDATLDGDPVRIVE